MSSCESGLVVHALEAAINLLPVEFLCICIKSGHKLKKNEMATKFKYLYIIFVLFDRFSA